MTSKQNSKKNYEKELKKESRRIVTKIIELYPDLKQDKKMIMNHIKKPPKKKKKDKTVKTNNELIVEQIEYNNKKYYKGQNGEIYDKTSKFIGVMDKRNNNIILFDILKKQIEKKDEVPNLFKM